MVCDVRWWMLVKEKLKSTRPGQIEKYCKRLKGREESGNEKKKENQVYPHRLLVQLIQNYIKLHWVYYLIIIIYHLIFEIFYPSFLDKYTKSGENVSSKQAKLSLCTKAVNLTLNRKKTIKLKVWRRAFLFDVCSFPFLLQKFWCFGSKAFKPNRWSFRNSLTLTWDFLSQSYLIFLVILLSKSNSWRKALRKLLINFISRN